MRTTGNSYLMSSSYAVTSSRVASRNGFVFVVDKNPRYSEKTVFIDLNIFIQLVWKDGNTDEEFCKRVSVAVN